MQRPVAGFARIVYSPQAADQAWCRHCVISATRETGVGSISLRAATHFPIPVRVGRSESLSTMPAACGTLAIKCHQKKNCEES